MDIVKIIKNTALIVTISWVSLNAFAASELPEANAITDEWVAQVDTAGVDLTDDSNVMEQMRCIADAVYQATYYNTNPEDLSAILEACGASE